MGSLKRFLLERLSDKQVVVLRTWKRRLLGQEAGSGPLSYSASLNYGIEGPETSLGLLWPWNHEVSRLPPALPSGKPWPRISVVTATRDQGAYLEETMRSVLLQGYPNLEYILVDGSSTDNTRAILQRYRDRLAACVSEPDKGQSDALNKGLSRATGDVLAWLNSDDQYLPNTLRVVAETFDRSDADMVAGGTVIVRDHERHPVAIHHSRLPYDQTIALSLPDLADFDGKWRNGDYFYQPEVFWKRTIWERAGSSVREDLKFAMDYELWLRFASHGARIRHVRENLAIFRVHGAQKTFRAHADGRAAGRSEGHYPEHRAVSRLFVARVEGIKRPPLPPTDRPLSAADVADTIPETIFDRRPVQECRTPHGTFFVPLDSIQDEAAQAIRAGRVTEPAVLDAARKHIVAGTVVLDIGAGFGQLAVLFSRLAGDEGQVLSFEADDYVFDILQRNLRANQCLNVRAFLGAVFDDSRAQVFFPQPQYARFPSYSTQRIDLAASGGKAVDALAIDMLHIQAPVSFMRVRGPGSELHALRGATATINRFRMPIVVELEDLGSGDVPSDIAVFLGSVRYRIVSRLAGGFLALPEERSAAARGEAVVAVRQSPGIARPNINVARAPFMDTLCKLLRSRQEVEVCTRFLKRNGFVSHNLRCKDWDLAHIIPAVGDGNFLDMGSSDSYILMNLSLKRIDGELHGIDLQQPDVPVAGVRYSIGDLMKTGLPSGHFSNITCLSVLEHQVDYSRFAAEVSRLLAPGGRLFVTFDYWEPKLRPPIKLYGLDWQPLDVEAVRQFTTACAAAGLHLIHDFDWTAGEPVIQWGYYSPHPEMAYTFGMASFRKS
jgi:FkbM family methyltransferase